MLPQRLHNASDSALTIALTVWQNQAGPNAAAPDDAHCRFQKSWDVPVCKAQADKGLNAAQTEADRARLLASKDSNSGMWLKAIPLATVGLKLEDEVVRIAVGLRLGTNICEAHDCACGVRVDSRGTHGLACKYSAGRHPRHGQLNDVICRALQRAQIPAVKEPVGLCRSDGKRPDGVTMIPWARGRCLAWDATVVDTLAPSHISDSATTAGSAAARAEVMKTSKYTDISITHTFIPLAFETLGSWGQQCDGFVRELGRRLSVVTGEKRDCLSETETIDSDTERQCTFMFGYNPQRT